MASKPGKPGKPGTLPPRWASVDPARSSGVAVWEGAALVRVALLVDPRHADWREAFEGCELVVAEDAYIRHDVSRASYGTMRRSVGVMADAAGEVGAHLVMRPPSEWRAPLGFPRAADAAKATALGTLRALVASGRLPIAGDAVEARQFDMVEAVMIGVSELIRAGRW